MIQVIRIHLHFAFAKDTFSAQTQHGVYWYVILFDFAAGDGVCHYRTIQAGPIESVQGKSYN